MNTKPKRKLTKREASLLGTAAARPVIEKLKQERIAEYNKNPLLCKNCGNPIPYEKKVEHSQIFCSRSCAATYNNKRKPPKSLEIRQKISDSVRTYLKQNPRQIDPSRPTKLEHLRNPRKCMQCGKPVKNPCSVFCSNECFRAHEWNEKKKAIQESGILVTDHCGETNSKVAKRYLSETFGNKCSKCGISELNGSPVPLQVHHLDGDAMNSKIENLVLLCPTCHAMTENFSNKNNHRSTRESRKRYWTTKDDRRDLSVYRAELALGDKPSGIFPFNDIREDMIPIEEQIEMGMLKPDFKP